MIWNFFIYVNKLIFHISLTDTTHLKKFFVLVSSEFIAGIIGSKNKGLNNLHRNVTEVMNANKVITKSFEKFTPINLSRDQSKSSFFTAVIGPPISL